MRLQDAIDMARSTGSDLVLGSHKARWVNDALYWVCHDNTLGTSINANGTVVFGVWELATPPPKRYTFEEALVMMRQGKWMRPVLQQAACNKYYRRLTNASVYMEMDAKDGSEVGCADILLSYCDAMWEERP